MFQNHNVHVCVVISGEATNTNFSVFGLKKKEDLQRNKTLYKMSVDIFFLLGLYKILQINFKYSFLLLMLRESFPLPKNKNTHPLQIYIQCR
jgi:hypothetical protein